MTADTSKPSSRRASKQLQFEQLTDRLLMAADIIWENNSPPAGFSLTIENGSLVFNGSATNDSVTVADIVAKKNQKQLVTGAKYIEISHSDDKNRLRHAWVKQDDSLSFTFFGNNGNDKFQYIDTTADPGPRRDRVIMAHGGAGNDTLYGYSQNDALYGDNGHDDLFGGAGDDLLMGGVGNDRLWGDAVSSSNQSGTSDSDYLEGGLGVDKLYGWQGNDILNGGNYWDLHDGAVDELYGGADSDSFYLESLQEAKDMQSRDGDQRVMWAPQLPLEWFAEHRKR